MLVGTCVRRGAYVTVAVQLDERERPHVVLEAERTPGGPSRRVALERESFADALWFAERCCSRAADCSGPSPSASRGAPSTGALPGRCSTESWSASSICRPDGRPASQT